MKERLSQTFFLICTLLASAFVSANTVPNELIKVPVNQLTQQIKVDGLETHFGQKFSLKEVVQGPKKKSTIKSVLKDGQIELKSGEIIYSEEVEYGLIFKNTRNAPFPLNNQIFKAPKNDED